MELLSVPYALYAKTAGTTSGNTAGFTHYVGELFGGGIVVSVWKKNGEEHGLIASLTNLSTGIQWTTPTFESTSAAAGSMNDGFSNTNAIVAQAGEGTNYAAGLCKAYNAGGYTDWYLPALDEFKQCIISYLIVNEILGSTNGFTHAAQFWTSTQRFDDLAAVFDFRTLYYEWADGKSAPFPVRAFRRF